MMLQQCASLCYTARWYNNTAHLFISQHCNIILQQCTSLCYTVMWDYSNVHLFVTLLSYITQTRICLLLCEVILQQCASLCDTVRWYYSKTHVIVRYISYLHCYSSAHSFLDCSIFGQCAAFSLIVWSCHRNPRLFMRCYYCAVLAMRSYLLFLLLLLLLFVFSCSN